MRASQLLTILFGLLLSSATQTSAAQAGSPPDLPDPREAEAKKLCDAGDVLAGVALLAQIHVETLNPLYLYRQALCYQHNHQDASAIERYREYLRRNREISDRTRQWVQYRILELEASRRPRPVPLDPTVEAPAGPLPIAAPATALRPASTAADLAVTSTPAGPTVGGARSNPLSTVAGSTAPTTTTGQAPAPSQSWQRFSSLLLATGAGAALGTAVTFHLAREDSVRQYNRSCFPERLGDCSALEARFKFAGTGALVGYLTAALLAGGSTYLYLSSPESRRPASPRSTLAALSCSPSINLDTVACAARF